MRKYCIPFLSALLVFAASCKKEDSGPKAEVIEAAGNIQSAITQYRTLLGADNGGVPGTQGATGFREISWDGVDDANSSPNFYPSDFFNAPTAPRARGIVITTPGTGLQVSADSSNPTATAPNFGHINPTYTAIFPPFSNERLFSPVGSNIADIRFYVPGTDEKAVVRGFGAVYVDVDKEENASFEYFDINDKSLGVYATPVLNEGHVFLGVLFENAIVHRVRVAYGNSALGPNESSTVDVSVMDNFIYGEPQAAY